MKSKRHSGRVFLAGVAFALLAVCAWDARAQTPQGTIAPTHAQAFAAFEARGKEHVAVREHLEDWLPKLSTGATREQIEAAKTAFQDAVRAARPAAKQGDLFTAAL